MKKKMNTGNVIDSKLLIFAVHIYERRNLRVKILILKNVWAVNFKRWRRESKISEPLGF